jgi:hypothetical protein
VRAAPPAGKLLVVRLSLLLLNLSLLGSAACLPAQLDQREVLGASFFPLSAVWTPLVYQEDADEPLLVSITLSSEPDLCGRLRADGPRPEAESLLGLSMSRYDASLNALRVVPGDYDVRASAGGLSEGGNANAFFSAREACGNDPLLGTATGGRVQLDRVELEDGVSGSFRLGVRDRASGGDPETISGTFDAAWCDVDLFDLSYEDSCDTI